ncbi:MAG TPA: hypothetical protein VLA92_05170 [Candidatus Saccharimonadales bacterium]|nr:hypothetical protein [Candidatus Saccharimonadales bacterium]
MSNSETAPTSSEGQFTCKDFYDRAIGALLRKAYKGDGYRVEGRLTIPASAYEAVSTGRWTLTDKYSYESAAYNLSQHPSLSQQELRRVQEAGKSVLYLELKTDDRRSLGYYHGFWPDELRPGLELYERLHANSPRDDVDFAIDQTALDLDLYCTEEVHDPFPIAQWPANQPHIYKEQATAGHHMVTAVTEPYTDPYLAQVYRELPFR